MSMVQTYECDICAKRRYSSRSTGPVMWGEYRDINGQLYQVCDACAKRLMKPLIRRVCETANETSYPQGAPNGIYP